MIKFGDAERNIASLLTVGLKFFFEGNNYKIIKSGKPTCKKGEPKTDVYVLAEDYANKKIEIKISFKKENADFIENKTSSERAYNLFGPDWQTIIKQATLSIKEAFENKKLIYQEKGKRVEEGSITLGWKYELLNKTGGELSGLVDLTREQTIDIYAGTHLNTDKKNATVNGETIANSGVANFILMNDTVSTTQEVIDNIISIDDYVAKYPNVYFACKALNYRTYCNKFDGNRPLSVYVDWTIVDGKLNASLVYDNPLNVKGNEVANKLTECLTKLNIETTKDITDDLVVNPKIILKKLLQK